MTADDFDELMATLKRAPRPLRLTFWRSSVGGAGAPGGDVLDAFGGFARDDEDARPDYRVQGVTIVDGTPERPREPPETDGTPRLDAFVDRSLEDELRAAGAAVDGDEPASPQKLLEDAFGADPAPPAAAFAAPPPVALAAAFAAPPEPVAAEPDAAAAPVDADAPEPPALVMMGGGDDDDDDDAAFAAAPPDDDADGDAALAAAAGPKRKTFGTAVFPFVASEEWHATMAAGERVEVIDAMDDGWSHVRVAGAVGCVPSSYVAVADDRARDAAAAEQLAAAFADDLETLARHDDELEALAEHGRDPRSPSATPTKLRGGRGDALDGPLAAPVRAASVERALDGAARAPAEDARAVAPAHTPWAPAPVEVGDPFAPLGAPVRVASIDFETLKARAAAPAAEPPAEPASPARVPSPPSDPPPEAEATVDAPPFAAIPAVAAAPPSDPPPEPEPEPFAAIPAFAAAPPPPALAPAPPAAAPPAPVRVHLPIALPPAELVSPAPPSVPPPPEEPEPASPAPPTVPPPAPEPEPAAAEPEPAPPAVPPPEPAVVTEEPVAEEPPAPPAPAASPREGALRRQSSGAGGKKCAHCGQTLPLGKFSKKQWKAGPGVRKCKDCEDDHHF